MLNTKLSFTLKSQVEKTNKKTKLYINEFFQRFFANFTDDGSSIHLQMIEVLLESYFLTLKQKPSSFSRKSNSLKAKLSKSKSPIPNSIKSEYGDDTRIKEFEPYKTMLSFLSRKELEIEGGGTLEKAQNLLDTLRKNNTELSQNEIYEGFWELIRNFLSQAISYSAYQDFLESKQLNKVPLLMEFCHEVINYFKVDNAADINFYKLFSSINELIDKIRDGHIKEVEEIKPLEFIIIAFRDQLIDFLKKYLNSMRDNLRSIYELISSSDKVSVKAFWVLENIIEMPEDPEKDIQQYIKLIEHIYAEIEQAQSDSSKIDKYYLFETQIENIFNTINRLSHSIQDQQAISTELKYNIAKIAYQYNFFLQISEITRVRYLDPAMYENHLELIQEKLPDYQIDAEKLSNDFEKQKNINDNFNLIVESYPFDLNYSSYQTLNVVKYQIELARAKPESDVRKELLKIFSRAGMYQKDYADMWENLLFIYQKAKEVLDEKYESHQNKFGDSQQLEALKIFELDSEIETFLNNPQISYDEFELIKEKVIDFLIGMVNISVLQHNFSRNYFHTEASTDARISKRGQRFPSSSSDLNHWDGHLRNGTVSMMGASSENDLVLKLVSLDELYQDKSQSIFILAIGKGGSDFIDYRKIESQKIELNGETYYVEPKSGNVLGYTLQLKQMRDKNSDKSIRDFVVYNIVTDDNTPIVLNADTRKNLQSALQQEYPLSIHCASGVGRTGQVAFMREAYNLIDCLRDHYSVIEKLSDDGNSIYTQLRKSKEAEKIFGIFGYTIDELELGDNPMHSVGKFSELAKLLLQLPKGLNKLCDYQKLSEEEAIAINKVFSAILAMLRSSRYTIQTKAQYMAAIKEAIMYYAQYNLRLEAVQLNKLDEYLMPNRAFAEFDIEVPEVVVRDSDNKRTRPSIENVERLSIFSQSIDIQSDNGNQKTNEPIFHFI